VIESMASGVPTITSFGSSLEEVAGDAALLIDPAETDSIAEALEKVLADQKLRDRLAASGLKRASRFQPDDLVKKALSIYRTVAAE
jgi:glycosyltransferase involved in cell wall biosynthesis